MGEPELIQVFDFQSEAYKRAFQIFLDHTDQKRNAIRFLQGIVDDLPNRNVFIDAGAGNGELTRAFAGAFHRTIAIEPNGFLLTQLKQALPQVESIAASILAADPEAKADFVLCSHALYYIPAEEWLTNLERLVSWTSPNGVTVIVAQNHATDCMAMLDHFFGCRFDLHRLAEAFREKHGTRYQVAITLDPAHVETRDRTSAYAIAEFMLNPLPRGEPPARRDIKEYLAKHCLRDGTYRLSVHQDFLQIRERNCQSSDKAKVASEESL